MKDLFDLFGEPFKLNYNGKYLFKTSLSAIISIFFIITTTLCAIWNIYRLEQYSDLMMNNYQTIMSKDDPPLYTLNNANYYFPFKLIGSGGVNILNPNNSKILKYFNIYSKYYYGNKTNQKLLNIT